MNKKIIIGSANFNQFYGLKKNKISNREIELLIKLAKRHGINKIDTSPSYKGSEKIIGKFKYNKLKINTKIPKIPNHIGVNKLKSWVSDIVKKSFINLKVKKINSITIQNSDILLSNKGSIIYNELKKLKNKKKISKIGISIYDFKKLQYILKKFKIDLIQVPFNIFDQRLIDSGWINRLKKRKIEIHIRSVFLQGLLLLRSNQLPKKFKRYSVFWNKLEKWKKMSKLNSVQACLSVVKKYPQIRGVIIGFNNSDQLKNILSMKNIKSRIPSIYVKDQKIYNPIKW